VSDRPPSPPHRRARRLGAALLTLLVALGGVALLILFFQGRDSSQLDSAGRTGPGQALADGGSALVGDGVIRIDGERMDGAQVAQALELGNVVLLYGSPAPPPPLHVLSRQLAGEFDPALLRSGQAVVLARRAGLDGFVALAWGRILRTGDPADPALEAFASHWLGRGADG
jgi:hypothetical protein